MEISTRRIGQAHSTGTTASLGQTRVGRRAQIKLIIGNWSNTGLVITVTHPLILGRGAQSNAMLDINLTGYDAAEQGVSRTHATLQISDDALMVCDLNSTNGTFLNQERVMPGKPRLVCDGDEIRLGQLPIYVVYMN